MAEATIRYSMNGNDPTENSPIYTQPVLLDAGEEIRARAFRVGYRPSNVLRYKSTELLSAPSPTINQSGNNVTITTSLSNGTIYYRLGDSGNFVAYTRTITITAEVTIYAYVTANGYEQSPTIYRNCPYYICATPTISQSGNTVFFNCSTTGATITYSGCGVSGTTVSGGSVTISQSGTMTAYATLTGYARSSTASRSCSYVAPSPSPGTQLPIPSVTMTTADYGDWQEIHYTLNNPEDYATFMNNPNANIEWCIEGYYHEWTDSQSISNTLYRHNYEDWYQSYSGGDDGPGSGGGDMYFYVIDYGDVYTESAKIVIDEQDIEDSMWETMG